jgi:hypothetical protein
MKLYCPHISAFLQLHCKQLISKPALCPQMYQVWGQRWHLVDGKDQRLRRRLYHQHAALKNEEGGRNIPTTRFILECGRRNGHCSDRWHSSEVVSVAMEQCVGGRKAIILFGELHVSRGASSVHSILVWVRDKRKHTLALLPTSSIEPCTVMHVCAHF